MTLGFEIRVFTNPWPDTVPQLNEILHNAVAHRAAGIAANFAAEEYRWERIAFAILDPTAPNSRPTDEAILAIACVGEEGPKFAPNALAKACAHRDHAIECGILGLTQKHRLRDGDFRHGFSAELNGTIIGSSGQLSYQDLYEATLLAAELNYQVWKAKVAWEEAQKGGGWYSTGNATGSRYLGLWEQSDSAEVIRGEA